ncbi:MAG: riboflavin biosynthesis protein RibF [Candidatus Eisenbacteria bacterium]
MGGTREFVLAPDEIVDEPVIATIGVFDGVHLGHRQLFARVVGSAVESGATSLAIGFDPHPVEVLAPHVPPHRISAPAVHRRRLAEAKLDHVWYLPFSVQIAALEPLAFVEMIHARFPFRELWIGYDFRFGRDRAGDSTTLVESGRTLGFSVSVFGPVTSGERPYSSTWVRESLRAGDVEAAASVLGAPFEIEGEIVRGLGLGARELVATANVQPHPRQLLPALGIYAGWARGGGLPDPVPAAISVGLRPTISQDLAVAVEAHLIDWSGDLYGQRLRICFGSRLREEKRFEGLDELRVAIRDDIAAARGLWETRHRELAFRCN